MAAGSKGASKAAGAAKGAVKALAGYSGIFHHLAGEHAEVSTLMKRVSATADSAGSERDELFAEIRRNLLAHAKGEEAEFYPVLREFDEIAALVGQCLSDHEKIEGLLDDLNVSDKSGSDWTRRFEQLVTAVDGHVDREEKELFPKANDLLEGQRAREIEQRYQDVEEREKSKLAR